jgi:hypothetical protein
MTQDPHLKNKTKTRSKKKAKWTGGMVHVVELLLCKHEALSLNRSPTKKKNKQNVIMAFAPNYSSVVWNYIN